MSREEQTTLTKAMFVWAGLAALLPIVAVGWMTRGAIEEINKASREAIARVEASVSAVARAQELHQATDEIETADLRRRVDGLEAWQLGRIGRVEVAGPHQVGLPVDRRNPRGMP